MIVGTSRKLGFAGKVEKGPSCTDRLLAGLPLNFPVDFPPLLGQADETAGPCLLLDRPLGVIADCGSFVPSHISRLLAGVIADCGYADNGVCILSGPFQRKFGGKVPVADHGAILSLKFWENLGCAEAGVSPIIEFLAIKKSSDNVGDASIRGR